MKTKSSSCKQKVVIRCASIPLFIYSFSKDVLSFYYEPVAMLTWAIEGGKGSHRHCPPGVHSLGFPTSGVVGVAEMPLTTGRHHQGRV